MQRLIPHILAALLVFAPIAGCGHRPTGARQIALTTADHWRIAADYLEAPGARKAVILLHQRGGAAGDWADLSTALHAAGIPALALDQRGAGRSTGPRMGAQAPWDTQGDIEAAVLWLEKHGIAEGSIGMAGASYGANNALIYASRHPVGAIALLSPGANYHGLAIAGLAARCHAKMQVTYAAGDTITENGPAIVLRDKPDAEARRLEGSAHGTDMLQADPSLARNLAAFFRDSLP